MQSLLHAGSLTTPGPPRCVGVAGAQQGQSFHTPDRAAWGHSLSHADRCISSPSPILLERVGTTYPQARKALYTLRSWKRAGVAARLGFTAAQAACVYLCSADARKNSSHVRLVSIRSLDPACYTLSEGYLAGWHSVLHATARSSIRLLSCSRDYNRQSSDTDSIITAATRATQGKPPSAGVAFLVAPHSAWSD